MKAGLSSRDRETIRAILAPYAALIDRAALFGSRGSGAARPNSDIDLVLFGDITDAEVDRLWTLFDESSLSVSVDVLAYREDMYPPLLRHIDHTARTLFTRDDLATARADIAA